MFDLCSGELAELLGSERNGQGSRSSWRARWAVSWELILGLTRDAVKSCTEHYSLWPAKHSVENDLGSWWAVSWIWIGSNALMDNCILLWELIIPSYSALVRLHLEYWVQFRAPQMGRLGWVQQKVTGAHVMAGGCGGCVLCGLKKKRWKEDPVAVSGYLLGGSAGGGGRLSFSLYMPKKKWKTTKPSYHKRAEISTRYQIFFPNKDVQTLGQVFQRGVGISIIGRIPNLSGSSAT